jgi:Pyruvate/2-oxoacid:ferredoxin oxidoreductase delta subunit
MAHQATVFAARADDAEPRHRCRVCGKTDLTDPQMDFRYCSKCAGNQCYCPEHIFSHEHVLVDEEAKH